MLQNLKRLPDSDYFIDKDGKLYLIRECKLDKQGRYTVRRKINSQWIRTVHYTPEKVKDLYDKLKEGGDLNDES